MCIVAQIVLICFYLSPIVTYTNLIYLWSTRCTVYYLSVHVLAVSKGVNIYSSYYIDSEIKAGDIVSFLTLIFIISDFYINFLLLILCVLRHLLLEFMWVLKLLNY